MQHPEGMRVCPTRTDNEASLLALQITVPQCHKRQREHYFKCPTCVHYDPTSVRESKRSRRVLELVLELPSGTSDHDLATTVAEAVRSADALCRAQGGHGLVLDSLQAEQPAATEVPA